MPSVPHLSIVAPCFNEEQTLPEFLRRVTAACRPLGVSYEIVLVNDGSRDRTWAVMNGLTTSHPALVCVNLSRNHGHQLALTAGLSVSRGERVMVLDADLQDPPELVGDMLRLMNEGADVVYGQRRSRAGESASKKLTAALFYRVIGMLTDVPIPRDTGDFRMLSRRVLDILLAMPERHRFIRGMVSWVGFRQVALVYDRDARFAGETSYPLRKMIRFALDAVTSFSIRPLTWASKMGFIFSGIAALLIVYSVGSWLTGKATPGWTSTMAVVSLLGSVQLFFLGLLGEYVGRLYDQSKGRPLFIIADIVGGEGAEGEGHGARAAARAGGWGDPGSPPVHVRTVDIDDLRAGSRPSHAPASPSTSLPPHPLPPPPPHTTHPAQPVAVIADPEAAGS